MIDKDQLDRIEAKLDALILLVSARGAGGPSPRPAPAPAPAPAYAPPAQPAPAPAYAPPQPQAYAPPAQAYAPPQPPAPQAPPPQQAYAPAPRQHQPPAFNAPAQRPFAPHAPTPPPAVDPNLPVADDEELDSKWGNPEIRKDPSRWKGESQVGKRFSDCPPEFLDILAGFYDWRAEKDEEKGDPRARFSRKDAARARGWARRIRAAGGGMSDPAFAAPIDAPLPPYVPTPGYQPPRAAPIAPLAPGENPDAEPAEPISGDVDGVPFLAAGARLPSRLITAGLLAQALFSRCFATRRFVR